MSRIFSVITVLALSLLLNPAAAQDLILVKPTIQAPIRAEPPSGLLGRPGAEVGQTDLSLDYVIIQRSQRQAGIGQLQSWVEIAPLGADGRPDVSQTGWVYWGRAGQESPNFKPSQKTRGIGTNWGAVIETLQSDEGSN